MVWKSACLYAFQLESTFTCNCHRICLHSGLCLCGEWYIADYGFLLLEKMAQIQNELFITCRFQLGSCDLEENFNSVSAKFNFLNITRLFYWGFRDQEMSANVTQTLHLTIAYKLYLEVWYLPSDPACSIIRPSRLSDPKPCLPLRSDNRESTVSIKCAYIAL